MISEIRRSSDKLKRYRVNANCPLIMFAILFFFPRTICLTFLEMIALYEMMLSKCNRLFVSLERLLITGFDCFHSRQPIDDVEEGL